jgi:hypothetical protein
MLSEDSDNLSMVLRNEEVRNGVEASRCCQSSELWEMGWTCSRNGETQVMLKQLWLGQHINVELKEREVGQH